MDGYHGLVRAARAEIVRAALERAGGNRSAASRVLGIQRTYLQRLVRELGVHVAGPARGHRVRG